MKVCWSDLQKSNLATACLCPSHGLDKLPCGIALSKGLLGVLASQAERASLKVLFLHPSS